MILKLKRTPGLYLVGFMGCGKSTVGGLVAYELGWTFIDLDEEIQSAQQRTIAQIFDQDGEPAFRKMESDMLHDKVRLVQRGRPLVLALGGGAFTIPENYELIEENGVSIWLDCPIELICERIGDPASRPLARDPVALAALYERRRQMYARADFRIDASGDAAAVCASILKLPIF
jgi:shikimate kinase